MVVKEDGGPTTSYNHVHVDRAAVVVASSLPGQASLAGDLAPSRRGHLTDRYTKAIDQLGSKTLDVRLGGLYALEQLAHDSKSHRDRDTIVEVLSGFARERSNPIYRYRSHLKWLGQEKPRGSEV